MPPERHRLNVHVPSHEDEAMAEVMTAPLSRQLERFEAWGLPRAGLLILMSACQGRCFFCASPPVTAPGPEIVTQWQRVASWLEQNRAHGVEQLCLGGTEPPTHEHFSATLELAQQVGFRSIQLMTSGLSLDSLELARSWYSAGIRSVCVPLYAADAEVHDAVVGVPGHFERATRGLDNARAAGIEPLVHTLALRRNLAELHRLAALTQARWSSRLTIAPLRAKDEVFDFNGECVSYAQLERAIETADVSLIGFPLCVATETPRQAALLIELYFRAQKLVYAASCDGCSLRPKCPGLVAAQHARYGSDGLRPSSAD
jgi:pyruvate-formate lyase-activating enzyme